MKKSKKENNQPLVLVADPDAGTRQSISKTLEHSGFSVHEAEDGNKALSIFKMFHPDIVLLDVRMPDIDDLSVLEALRTIRTERPVPIILLGEPASMLSPEQLHEMGICDFIRHARKPQAFKPGDEWHPGTEPALAGGVEENQA